MSNEWRAGNSGNVHLNPEMPVRHTIFTDFIIMYKEMYKRVTHYVSDLTVYLYTL